jgi:hypothetical protein
MKKINLTQKVQAKDLSGKEETLSLGKDFIVQSLTAYPSYTQNVNFDEVYSMSVLKRKIVTAIDDKQDSLLVEKSDYDIVMKTLKAGVPRLPIMSDIYQIIKDMESLPDVPVTEKKK